MNKENYTSTHYVSTATSVPVGTYTNTSYSSTENKSSNISYVNNSGNTNTSGYSSYVTGGAAGAAGSNGNSGGAYVGRSQFPTLPSDVPFGTSNAAVTAANTYANTNSYGETTMSTEYISSIRAEPLNLQSSSFVHDDRFAQEVLAKAGPANTYQRKEYLHDVGYGNEKNSYREMSTTENYTGYSTATSSHNEGYESHSAASVINQDPSPIRIVKPNNQNIVYKQQVSIRYLQPPTPPPPAPIIIREKQLPAPQAAPPIIIRQTAPAPPTPPPLTIREKAPTPPPVLEPTIIEKPLPAPPAPPRQVIIERIPAPPSKPRPIIYEKWLPYKESKRPVIIQKFKQIAQAPPKNIIIEYEKPKAVAVRHVIEEGVFRVDPATYQVGSSNGEIRYVDRITDLPIENSKILQQYAEAYKNKSTSFDENLDQILHTTTTETNSYASTTAAGVGVGAAGIGSLPNLLDNNYYSTEYQTAYTSSTTYPTSAEYETITTTVSKTLADKIIAEARAAGAIISRSSSIARSGSAPLI